MDPAKFLRTKCASRQRIPRIVRVLRNQGDSPVDEKAATNYLSGTPLRTVLKIMFRTAPGLAPLDDSCDFSNDQLNAYSYTIK